MRMPMSEDYWERKTKFYNRVGVALILICLVILFAISR